MTLSQKEMQRCPLHPTRPGSTIQDEPTTTRRTTRAAGTTTGLATVQVTLRRTCTCVSFSLSLWSSAYPPLSLFLCLCHSSSRPSSLSASSHVRSLKEFPLWSSNRELKCAHTHTHTLAVAHPPNVTISPSAPLSSSLCQRNAAGQKCVSFARNNNERKKQSSLDCYAG